MKIRKAIELIDIVIDRVKETTPKFEQDPGLVTMVAAFEVAVRALEKLESEVGNVEFDLDA